jgi:hypothetical protein
MGTSEPKRMHELELENGNLKRLLAEVHLDIYALKSVNGTFRDDCLDENWFESLESAREGHT